MDSLRLAPLNRHSDSGVRAALPETHLRRAHRSEVARGARRGRLKRPANAAFTPQTDRHTWAARRLRRTVRKKNAKSGWAENSHFGGECWKPGFSPSASQAEIQAVLAAGDGLPMPRYPRVSCQRFNCFSFELFVGISNMAPPWTIAACFSMVSQRARRRSICLVMRTLYSPFERKKPTKDEL
jgi:hypothetical protein